MTATYEPPPVCALSNARRADTSVSVFTTESRLAVRLALAVVEMRPTPPETEKLAALPVTVHAPPVSAVPKPLLTVRVNASVA